MKPERACLHPRKALTSRNEGSFIGCTESTYIYLNKVRGVLAEIVIYVKLNKFQKLIHRPEMNEMKYNIYNYKSVHES